jgi:hypothetical protein
MGALGHDRWGRWPRHGWLNIIIQAGNRAYPGDRQVIDTRPEPIAKLAGQIARPRKLWATMNKALRFPRSPQQIDPTAHERAHFLLVFYAFVYLQSQAARS